MNLFEYIAALQDIASKDLYANHKRPKEMTKTGHLIVTDGFKEVMSLELLNGPDARCTCVIKGNVQAGE